MGKIQYINGTGIPHKSFEEEFLTHKKCSEWWYCTGYLGNVERLFSYQFTLAKVRIAGIKFHILICAVTDIKNQKHYNIQKPIFFGKNVTTNAHELSVGELVKVKLQENKFAKQGKMSIFMKMPDFELNVELNTTKAPVWHCDDGVLQMGIQNNDKEKTYYYSYTNMETIGDLKVAGEEFKGLKGKTWFDRQGGTYSLTKSECNWEWFSLRFFDNHEIMLFAFPHVNYYDGTYIDKDGNYRRLNDYKITATEVITYNNMKFSNKWDLEINGKQYQIVPKTDGMFNIFFFELLASIIDETGKEVGYAFVELLPGVRNKNKFTDAFRKKK